MFYHHVPDKPDLLLTGHDRITAVLILNSTLTHVIVSLQLQMPFTNVFTICNAARATNKLAGYLHGEGLHPLYPLPRHIQGKQMPVFKY